MTVATYDATLVAFTPAASGAPTLVELGPVPYTALVWSTRLGDPGTAVLAAPVDKLSPDVAARLRDLVATPCELWLRRIDTSAAPATAELVHAGPVVGWSIEGRTITVTSRGLAYWLDYMWQTDDVSFTSTDQATIVASLVNAYQAQSYAHRGLYTTTLTASGVTRDLTVTASEGRNVAGIIREMGGRENGYDLDVATDTRQLQLWSPRRGSDLTASVVLDERSIGTPRVAASCAAGIVATDLLTTSGSSTGVTLTSRATTGSLATFGRAGFAQSFQDISQQGTLDDHASRLAADMGAQHLVLTPVVLPVSGFTVGDFTVGDLVQYDHDAGIGRVVQTVRVQSIEVRASEGAELLTIGVV